MILITYGTRPEYIKIKPLIAEMTKRQMPFKTLFTGQHQDIAPHAADFVIAVKDFGPNRLDNIIQNCLNLPDAWFEGIDYLLVQGDTTSVVGLSLAALHRKIKIVHLEAGLRTHDGENPFPEENNRRIVSTLASIHFCPTTQNKWNLIAEFIDSGIYVVGNTALDNLVAFRSQISYEKVVLITLHRRENHKWIDKWFVAINNLADAYQDYEFVLPLHPNPDVQKHKHLLSNVNVVNCLPHEELLKILLKSSLVITDSGGLQEECSFLHKKCLVCRKVTERPESVGWSSFLVENPVDLWDVFKFHIENNVIDVPCPYGDGTSSNKICNILQGLNCSP